MSVRDFPSAELFDRAVGGERQCLGRLLTLIERGEADADEITQLTFSSPGDSHTVGITGAPGSGKSTLVGWIARLADEAGRRPAVLAVDPSSPLTGGAILGDRIRMDDVANPDTFIRSMATRGHSGGLALAVPAAVRVLRATGFDPILIETVGVGQVEVDIASTADSTLVVVTPGWGDAVQANKAGLLEVGDIFVVNKADRPGANDARRDLDLMLDLGHVSGLDGGSDYRPPIVMTTATEGEGAGEAWEAITKHFQHLKATGELGRRRSAGVRREIHGHIVTRLENEADARLDSDVGRGIVAAVADHQISPAEAARQLLASIRAGS